MATEATDQLAQGAFEALHGVFGTHDGSRAAHAKGTWVEATFTGTDSGRALCRAPFLSEEPIRALVRFSNGSGDPQAHDGVRDGRGVAIKLFLPDGGVTDIVMLSVPMFSSRTPEDFIELLSLVKPDPETGHPDLARLGPYLQAHPETAAAVQARLSMGPPASYATTQFNGIHAFRWTGPDGTARWVRTRLVPDAGVQELPDDEAMARDPHYLHAELPERLPASFTLVARLAADGDPLDDATAAWPEEREAVEVGRLTLERAIPDPETPDDIHVFDPLRVCEGIEPSDDPILHLRRRVYDLSARARWSGVMPGEAS